MASFLDDNDDLRFYLERGIEWEPLVQLTEWGFHRDDGFSSTAEAVEFYGDVLELVGSFAAEAIDPLTAQLDRDHPRLEDGEVVYPEATQELFDALDELELHGLCVPRELGGMNAPMLLFHMNSELFARADVSVCAHHGFHGGLAMAALVYSVMEGTTRFDTESKQITETRFQEVIDSIVQGGQWGSMDITEPDAGSDMAALRCRAEQADDGSWTVTGDKMWITSGHGKWHFVIARTEDAGDPADPFAGLEGLSMFIVPAFEEGPDGEPTRLHTELVSVEDKLGHSASATVAIRFDGAPAHLVGQRGEGFRYMLLLMNNARVGVGFEALGLCEASYRLARDYAAQRGSMGKTIDRHEMIFDLLDEMYTNIQGIRALCMEAGWHEEVGQKLRVRLRLDPPADPDARADMERQAKRHQRAARRLTPLLKHIASEEAVAMARQCIQIHGGVGYSREVGAEKLLRDAMVMPIYEGTSQIQALMAMKDTLLDVVRRPQAFVRNGAAYRWRALSARDPLERRVARLQSLRHQAIRHLLTQLITGKLGELRTTRISAWADALSQLDPKRDFALAMLHAERLCRLLTQVAVAEVLLEQAQQHDDRDVVLERWLERAEPRCRAELDWITSTGHGVLSRLHGRESTEASGSSDASSVDDGKAPRAAK